MPENTGTLPLNKNNESKSREVNKKTNKKGKKIKLILKILAILLVLATIFLVSVKFDLFNMGKNFSKPISKVPLIGSLISNNSSTNSDLALEISNIEKMKKSQLISELKNQLTLNSDLQKKIESLNKSNVSLGNKVSDLTSASKDYKSLEKKYTALLNEKAKLEKALVEKDPAVYTAYYEKLNPDAASQLYIQLKKITEKNKALEENIKNISNYYATMEAESAAAALEKLYSSNKTLAIQIFSKMSTDVTAEIFAQMKPAVVKNITQDLYLSGVNKVNNQYGTNQVNSNNSR